MDWCQPSRPPATPSGLLKPKPLLSKPLPPLLDGTLSISIVCVFSRADGILSLVHGRLLLSGGRRDGTGYYWGVVLPQSLSWLLVYLARRPHLGHERARAVLGQTKDQFPQNTLLTSISKFPHATLRSKHVLSMDANRKINDFVLNKSE